MADKSLNPLLPKLAPLLLSTSLTSLSLAYSTVLTPRILTSPVPLMLTQWRSAYCQGRKYMPPPALLAALSYIYLGTRSGLSKSKMGAYFAAAALTFGIVPYTIGIMGRVNRMLEGRARVVERVGRGEVVKGEEEVGIREEGAWVNGGEVPGSRFLVDRWAVLNLGRTVMLAVGVGLGVWAAL